MSDYIGLPRVKTAALGAITGGLSAYRERENLRKAGLPEYAVDAALTTTGGVLRGLGRDLIYGGIGGGLGSLGAMGIAAGAGPRVRKQVSDQELAGAIDRASYYGTLAGSLLSAYHQAGSEEERAQKALARYTHPYVYK